MKRGSIPIKIPIKVEIFGFFRGLCFAERLVERKANPYVKSDPKLPGNFFKTTVKISWLKLQCNLIFNKLK